MLLGNQSKRCTHILVVFSLLLTRYEQHFMTWSNGGIFHLEHKTTTQPKAPDSFLSQVNVECREILYSYLSVWRSPLLIRSALCFWLAVAWRERKTFVFIHHFPHSPDLNHNLCTPWPCIDFPSHLLSDWPAEGMCADTWPAITPLTSQTVNTDRLHTVSPSGLRFDQSCGS